MEITKPLPRGLMAAEMIGNLVNENTRIGLWNEYLEYLKLAAPSAEIRHIEQQIRQNSDQIAQNHMFLPWLEKVVEAEAKALRAKEEAQSAK